MRLIDNWREALTKFWSVHVAYITLGLSIAEQALPQLQGLIPPVTYAFLAGAFVVARLLAQPGVK